MRVTIIPSDGFVSVDGEGYSGIDLSFIPSDIHAIQWYENGGDVERQDIRGRIIANEEISDLTLYQPALNAWQMVKEASTAQPVEEEPSIV